MRRIVILVAAVMLTAASACAHPAQTLELEYYPLASPTALYSPAVRIGNTLYLTGQIGTDASGKLVAGGIQSEGRQALNNLRKALETYGSSMDRVAHCTIYLADFRDYADFNEIYASYFRARKPARSTVAVSALALNSRVELECIALVG